MNGLMGLSNKLDNENSFSFGVGLRAKKMIPVDTNFHKNTVETTINAGLFYDRNNFLMVSLFYSGLTDNTIQLNIYPGLFLLKGVSPGFWLVVKNDGNFILGLSTQFAPGIGISF